MPIPTPRSGESEDDFISRCIEFEVGQGRDQDQAAAMCYRQWREGKGMEDIDIGGQLYSENEIRRAMKAAWTTAYINDLPDSAFLYVEPGGEKDEGGNTTPRSKRHLPYKDKGGKVDLPHLRNALSRLGQSNTGQGWLSAGLRERLLSKARRILSRETGGKSIVKAITDTDVFLAGYGVVWGGRDLDGEYFTKSTDFWFDRITETPPVLYDHGTDGAIKKAVVGRVIAKATDGFGLWIESQIERANAYADAIVELTESGKLGFSSGAVPHLVDKAPNGEILVWPVVEFSLTPTPCEPRTLGVAALRSLAEAVPAVKALMPEDTDKVSAESAAGVGEAEALLLELEIASEDNK